MADFTSLQQKVNALKAKVEQNSITPMILGSILDDFIIQMQSIDMTGMSDDVQTAITNATQALSKANQAISASQNANNIASSAAGNAVSAYEKATDALTKATSALSAANSALTSVTEIENKIGVPDGIATLDSNGKVPSANLPGYVDDVIEFNSMVSGVTCQMMSSAHFSTDPGCMVVYDKDTDTFLLAVLNNMSNSDLSEWGSVIRPAKAQTVTSRIVGGENADIIRPDDIWSKNEAGSIIGIQTNKFTYFNNWFDADRFGDISVDGRIPESGKIYTSTSENKTYRWSGSELVAIGSDLALGYTASTAFPGDVGLGVKMLAEGVKIFSFHTTCYHPENELTNWPVGTIAFAVDNHRFVMKVDETTYEAVSDYHTDTNGSLVPRTDCIFRCNNCLYAWKDSYLSAFVIGEEQFNEIGLRVDDIAIVSFKGTRPSTPGVINPPNGIYYVQVDPKYGRFVAYDEESEKRLPLYNTTETIDGVPTTVARQTKIFRNDNELYRYDGKKLEKLGGASVGNTYNVTIEKPLPAGEYYSDINADTQTHNVLDAVLSAGIAFLGMGITFAVASGLWKTYQYIGPNLTDSQLKDPKNWTDRVGMSAGNVINIHEITKDWNATNRGEAAGKVPESLRTGGRKITFMYSPGKWQTWQFVGTLVSDWSNESYWRQEVRSVSINNSPAPDPDANGNINLVFDVPIDPTLNGESERAVSNKAVVAGLAEVQENVPTKFGWDNNTRQLSLLSADGSPLDSVTIPGGGGGGDTNPTAIGITIESDLQATVKEGDDYTVQYYWHHYNINNNVDTQYGGTAELLVGGAVVDRQVVTQGYNSFNVGPWLQSGLNSVRIRITADDGLISQSATVKITAAALSLRSLYDISTANPVGASSQIRYIVNGSGDKQVSFSIDGGEPVTETIKTSGATSIKTLNTTAFYHSVHTLTMKATRDLGNGNVLATDELSFDMMFINRDSYKPLIALGRPLTAQQYSTIEIPFAVYDPENAQSAIVEIYHGETLVERQRVDRSLHTFSFRVKQYGEQTFTFKVQNSHLSFENSVTVDVIEASTQIEAETDGLSLYLSASGRSNDAENCDDWSFTSEQGLLTAAQFFGVKFDAQSGWRKDSNGITALHLEKGATCYIPFTPFITDAKSAGKTIEIEFSVSNCFDTSASIISCIMGNVGFDIKAQEATISSALRKTVGTKFKQDERIRVGFVIEPVAGTNRFMHLFVKGKHSGVVQYDTNDYFVQNPAQGITLGHASCELNIYNIRIYEQALSFRQMLNNAIADMDDTATMFAKLAANDILNDESAEGEISFEKAVKKIACLRYIGELPKYKGDKKIGWLVYEDPEHPEDNFMVLVQIDVQGTSSQYYVIKNFKVKFKGDLQMTNSGITVKKFALRCYDANGNLIPQKSVKAFCLKADFAESSGTHNTGAANMIDEILKAAGILTPMQEKDSTVRTTIYGNPCLLFHQETESSPIRFVGKYNFNNDKSTHETFGFQNVAGFNDGMINRDDYLVWDGRLSALQGNADALNAAEDAEAKYYLIENIADALNNHLVEYDETAGAWVDRGEMWRWNANLRAWSKNDGTTCTRAQGILDKVDAGELVENNIECWEFLNNGHPMCLFHASDYTTQVSSGLGSWVKETWLNKTDANGTKVGPYWTGAFEPRYPDNDDNNKRYAQGKIPSQLKRVTDWLASLSITDPGLTESEKNAKAQLFAGEIDQYLNKRMALAYDIIRQGFVAADQGAKNMMWAIIDGIIYIIFYDNDTIWLINNEGRIMFIPYVEPHSKDELGKFVFNGENSTLWNLIERSLQSEQRALYADMVASGFTYERALYWFNTRQSDKWCEAVKNADSKYKYINSFGKESEDGSGATNNYLDMAQGDREEHRKWAMYERFQYQNAKFGAGSFRESRIYLRSNTAGESAVPAQVAVDLTAAQDWYFAFRFSANDSWDPKRIEAGQTMHFEAPAGSNPNDTETYIHQADRLSDIGDISKLYPTTCDIAQGRMLSRLVVGNKTPGYRGKLATLTFGKHPLMTYINVCNIPTLSSTLDLTGCSALDEIEAQGSSISGISVPSGSVISKVHLPETTVRLEFDRLPNLTNANLIVDGYSNIASVNITDCAYLNPMSVLDAITATPNNSLQYIRVTGGTLRGTGEELIRLINLGVRGDNDKTGKPEILGTYHMTKLPESNELDIILNGINPDGFTVELVVEAFTNAMDEVNAETFNGPAEVESVGMDNILDHIRYYNGETAEDALARLAEENQDIHELITQID